MIQTQQEIASMREYLAQAVFSLPDTSAVLPSAVEVVSSPLASVPNLLRVERLTYGAMYPRVFWPSVPNGKLVIHCLGHSMGYDSAGAGDLTRALVSDGCVVAVCPMPGGNELAGGSSGTHSGGVYPLRTFIGPAVAARNHILQTVTPSLVGVVGLSGGGWATALLAGLGIGTHYVAIAGSFPLANPVNRDWEQMLPGISPTYDYHDFYIAGSVDGRFLQLHHTTDSCCFTLSQYNANPYAPTVAATAANLGGSYELRWFNTSQHAITPDDLSVTLAEFGIAMPIEYAISNSAPAPSYVESSPWQSDGKNNGYGGSSIRQSPAGDPKTATYKFAALSEGTYEFSVTWVSHVNRATNTPFTLRDSAGTVLATASVNQELSPSGTAFGGKQFQSLFTVDVPAGDVYLELTAATANEYAISDAVRIMQTTAEPDPPPNECDFESLRTQLLEDEDSRHLTAVSQINARINAAT